MGRHRKRKQQTTSRYEIPFQATESEVEDYGTDENRLWVVGNVLDEHWQYMGDRFCKITWPGWKREDGTNSTWEPSTVIEDIENPTGAENALDKYIRTKHDPRVEQEAKRNPHSVVIEQERYNDDDRADLLEKHEKNCEEEGRVTEESRIGPLNYGDDNSNIFFTHYYNMLYQSGALDKSGDPSSLFTPENKIQLVGVSKEPKMYNIEVVNRRQREAARKAATLREAEQQERRGGLGKEFSHATYLERGRERSGEGSGLRGTTKSRATSSGDEEEDANEDRGEREDEDMMELDLDLEPPIATRLEDMEITDNEGEDDDLYINPPSPSKQSPVRTELPRSKIRVSQQPMQPQASTSQSSMRTPITTAASSSRSTTHPPTNITGASAAFRSTVSSSSTKRPRPFPRPTAPRSDNEDDDNDDIDLLSPPRPRPSATTNTSNASKSPSTMLAPLGNITVTSARQSHSTSTLPPPPSRNTASDTLDVSPSKRSRPLPRPRPHPAAPGSDNEESDRDMFDLQRRKTASAIADRTLRPTKSLPRKSSALRLPTPTTTNSASASSASLPISKAVLTPSSSKTSAESSGKRKMTPYVELISRKKPSSESSTASRSSSSTKAGSSSITPASSRSGAASSLRTSSKPDSRDRSPSVSELKTGMTLDEEEENEVVGALTGILQDLAQQFTRAAAESGAAEITIYHSDADEDDIDVTELQELTWLENKYLYPDDWPKGFTPEEQQPFMAGCECNPDNGCFMASGCTCRSEPHENIDVYFKSKLKTIPPRGAYHGMITECNINCRCACGISGKGKGKEKEKGHDAVRNCGNRLAQLPRKYPIQLFRTTNRGWGARCPRDIPAGAILGFYTGMPLRRNSPQAEWPASSYCYNLDMNEILGEPDDESRMSVDGSEEEKFTVCAYRHGNWTRFVNHSCEPNAFVIPIIFDTVAGQACIPKLAFTSRTPIKAGEEITVDYNPSAGGESLSPGQMSPARMSPSRRGNAPTADEEEEPRGTKCRCGARKCRKWIDV